MLSCVQIDAIVYNRCYRASSLLNRCYGHWIYSLLSSSEIKIICCYDSAFDENQCYKLKHL